MRKENLTQIIHFLLLLAAFTISIVLAWTPRAHPAEAETQAPASPAAKELIVIIDFGGGINPHLINFFQNLNDHLSKWWENEGRGYASQNWAVFVRLNKTPPLGSNGGGRSEISVVLLGDAEGEILQSTAITVSNVAIATEAEMVAKQIAFLILQREQEIKKGGKSYEK